MGVDFSATHPGETERRCQRCGRAFIPMTRNQKYCAECSPSKNKGKGGRRKSGKPIEVRKAERFMDSNLKGLNDALFRQLGRIEEATGAEEIEKEISRSKSVCEIAGAIIQNGRLVLDASKASMTTAETVAVPKMLLGNGDGK